MAIPSGQPFPSFPTLTRMTRGLQGLLVIAGRPKVGKSTLAAQLAADVASAQFPGVYFEKENSFVGGDGSWTHASVLRAARKFGREHAGFEHLHHVRSSFDAAVAQLRLFRTGFLVVDTLSSSVGVDALDGAADLGAMSAAVTTRMHQLNELVNDGFSVLALSHVGRIYESGCPPLRSLMYTAAIEQLVWTTVAVWKNAKGDRFARVLASRLPIEPPYGNGDLRLIADAATEALTEGPLHVGGRPASATASAAPAGAVVKALAKAGGALAYGELIASVRRVAGGRSRATAARLIAAAVKAGQVKLEGRAYQLPAPADGVSNPSQDPSHRETNG